MPGGRGAARVLLAMASYLVVAGIGASVGAAAAPGSRTAAAVVGAIAAIVALWLVALVASDRRAHSHAAVQPGADAYYANLSAFVYGSGRHTRRLLIVLGLLVVGGLLVDVLVAFG